MSTSATQPDEGEHTTYAYSRIDDRSLEGDGGSGPRPLAVCRTGRRGDR